MFTAYFGVIEKTNYFDDFFGKNKIVWIEELHVLQKKRYKQLNPSSKQLEFQLISVYGTKSVFSYV